MAGGGFFPAPRAVSLREVIDLTGAEAVGAFDDTRSFTGVAPVGSAGPDDITFVERARYAHEAARAGACFCSPDTVSELPDHLIRLVVSRPHHAYSVVAARLFPLAMRPLPVAAGTGISGAAYVDPSAICEAGVEIEPGAVVGAQAEIGSGARIGPNAVIGSSVKIGRNTSVGPNASVLHALVGNGVIIHPGVSIGQDGFGFVPSATGHLKVPQLGRVIIQDDVEIGAGTTIDRGSGGDTVIGEGTKIDNLVQIGHNVRIGRGCLIVSQVGISGSAVVEDYVVIGGKSGINGHITLGAGCQIAGASSVYRDVPAGAKWGGAPARPYRDWLRAQSRDLDHGRSKRRGRAAISEEPGSE